MILTITINPAIDTRYFVDNYATDGVFRPTKTLKEPGGKGLNVTKVLKQLGADVTASGIVGGFNGDWLKQQLAIMNIQHALFDVAGETRICIAIINNQSGATSEILEPGEPISKEAKNNFIQHYTKLLDNNKIVTFSGSLLQGLPSSYYAKLIEIANKKELTTLLDSSGASLVAGLTAKPFLIKPNQDEISAILNRSINTLDEVIAGAKTLQQMGAQNVMVSLGGDGCVFVGERILKVDIPAIKISNAVGSGDASIAGFAKGLSDGLSLAETLKLSMACGMSNAQSMATGRISLDDVNGFIKQIVVREL